MAKKQTAKKGKKARRILSPSHTKGYYRFSKEFPSVTDSEGYRDNDLFVNSPAKKASVRRRLGILFACVFVAAYFIASVGFAISEMPVKDLSETGTGEIEKTVFTGYNSAYLSGDVLSRSSAESIIGQMRVNGVNAVVIDFKDAEGNFYFRPSINVSNEALYKASDNAQKIVKEFRDAGIAVFARFSCFADDIYARTNQKEAAFVVSSSETGSIESIWYSGGNDSHAWLNPYSAEVQYYLRVTAEDVADMNVDGIIFDYVGLPVNAGDENIRFAGQTSTDPSEEMASFISLLNSNFIKCKTAVVVQREVMLDAIFSGNAPHVFKSGCDYVVPDARLSLMPENTVIGTRKYAKPHLSPTEFITDYMNGIKKLASGDDYSVEIIPLLEASDTSGKQLSALAALNGNSYIMYNEETIYTADDFIAN